MTRKTTLPVKMLTAAVLLIGLLAINCDERDVPYIIDEDEIARYIRVEAEAQELFRSDSLIVSGTYQAPGSAALFYDSILSYEREVTVIVGDSAANYGSLGMLYEAVAVVNDNFAIRTLRMEGSDTTPVDHNRQFTRVGFFLKLGDDAQDYVGWKLWGIGPAPSTTPPVNVTVDPEIGVPYPGDDDMFDRQPIELGGDFEYIRISEIRSIAGGSYLALSTNIHNVQSPVRYYQLLAGAEDGGYMTRPMLQVDPESYADTLRTPNGNTTQYNVVLMQSFRDDTFQYNSGWFFYYRVPQ